MASDNGVSAPKKVLLTSVFGPFAVDDAFGRKTNLLESFHNQITKAQGIASMRVFFRSAGLYFIAENLSSPVTVLDFPTRKRFIQELQKEKYDVIGISFIVSTFLKACEMAMLVRKYLPDAKIVLGGHGAAIEGVENLIPCDHVVRGDGIKWFRNYLGENISLPINHPVLEDEVYHQVYGITTRNYPKPGKSRRGSILLAPGVGCVNGCKFCATSHFFGKEYIPFLDSAERIFEELCRLSDKLGYTEFRVMDENFLKDKERAQKLLVLIEKHQKPFTFVVFSSAETIESFGIKNMVRLGIRVVWLGVESRYMVFEKNRDRNINKLIAELKRHGIMVLASSILFIDEHTPETIWEDIDYVIDMNPDFTQFMQLMALPVTTIYREYKEQGRILFDLPFEDWHGQEKLNFKHPHFTQEEATRILNEAFKKEFLTLGSSMSRIAHTILQGVKSLRTLSKDDPWFLVRLDQYLQRAQELRILFPTIKYHARTENEKRRVMEVEQAYILELGRLSGGKRLLRWAALIVSILYSWKVKIFSDTKQPRTLITRYRWRS